MTTLTLRLALCSLVAAAGCGGEETDLPSRSTPPPLFEPPLAVPAPAAFGDESAARRAVATLGGVRNPLTGTAALVETRGGVVFVIELESAPPGLHGVHVHERGDCSDPDAESMGKHFNPHGDAHGLPGSTERHLGDLGNIAVGGGGDGRLEVLARDARLDPSDPSSILGRALIVHAGRDTGEQPSGHAGAPIACGVIVLPPSPG